MPFDLRCVLLAAAGYLSVRGADFLLGKAWDISGPMAGLVARLARELAGVPFLGRGFAVAMSESALYGPNTPLLSTWQLLATAVVFLAIWSFFGAAVLRTAALRLTRDEPLAVGAALAFGARNCLTLLLAPVLVLLLAGFFALANMAAGLVMSLWFVGSSLLAILLVPLVMISSVLVVVSLAGGLVGLPLMWAGISIEQNGALEALSRAYSYIFARPFRFFFGYLLVFVMMGLILLVSGHFEQTVKKSLKAGVVRTSLDDLVSIEPAHVEDVLEPAYLKSDRSVRETSGIVDPRNVREARWWDWVGFLWMCLWINAFLWGFKGYALYVFLGGTASLYLQLRRDVDGTDEEEIYPESEEEWEEAAAAAGTEPKWVAGEAEKPADAPAEEDEPDPGTGG